MGQGPSSQSVGLAPPLASLSAPANTTAPFFHCAFDFPEVRSGNEALDFLDGSNVLSDLVAREVDNPMVIVIPTHIHVIYTKDAFFERQITSENINNHMDRINAAFKPHGIQFDLKTHVHHVHPDVAVLTCGDALNLTGPHRSYFRDLYRGGAESMNLYYLSNACVHNGVFHCGIGVTRPPSWRVGTLPNVADLTGPTIWGDVMVSGQSEDVHAFISIHEIGHWLGLPHTFDASCNGGQKAFGLDTPPALRESRIDKTHGHCPHVIGCDGRVTNTLANNYMDYIPYDCPAEFTIGQGYLMRIIHLVKRLGKAQTEAAEQAGAIYQDRSHDN